MKLGEKIKYLRKSKGISQEELATMLKINRNFFNNIIFLHSKLLINLSLTNEINFLSSFSTSSSSFNK